MERKENPFHKATHETRITQKLEIETSEAKPTNTKTKRKEKLDYRKGETERK